MAELGEKTRDELIDEVVKLEQREESLVEEVNRVKDALVIMTDALEQSQNTDAHRVRIAAEAKAERLWTALINWYDKHKRGCEYAMQPGGFCPECIWVKRIIDEEEKRLEAQPQPEQGEEVAS